MKTAILTSDDVGRIVHEVGLNEFMDEAIRRLEDTCAECNAYDVPVRTGFNTGAGGLLEWMPVLENRRHATLKVVGYHPDNPSANALPTVLSTLFSFDAHTGHLNAITDGTFVTAVRTGAASAVASKVLARQESRVLGLLGTGAQAVAQTHALLRAFPIEQLVAVDINVEALERFTASVQRLPGLRDLPVQTSTSTRVLERADIICTATSVAVGAGPVLRPGDFQRHLHINAVGSDFPGKIELAREILEQSFLVADFRPQAILEGESQQVDGTTIRADLVELVRGADQFAAKREELTVFDSTGFALEDHVVVAYLHELAGEMGLGTLCQIETVSDIPSDPYYFLASTPV